MLKKAYFYLLILAGLVVLAPGCKSYQKVLKSPDNELKYTTAVDLYESGHFKKALTFFDLVRTFYQGTKKGENVTYYTANSYFQIKDYQLASYYFKQYQQMYPRGKMAQEAAFLQAYCTYLRSPRYELDQSISYQAIDELKRFISNYPNSSKVAKAKELIAQLNYKQEEKDYNIALLYYKMGSYEAAITSFQNLLDDYPDSKNKETYLYYIGKTYYDYAEKSIPQKQKERFEKMVEAYNNLLYLYPDSKYLKELKPLSEKAMSYLK
ncbi:MAG: outer membrane protein assembly factor BamD [Bacteroidales bacterium]|nr:outer membrane protein assembly factor BamD [Bacteroidales bacterium]